MVFNFASLRALCFSPVLGLLFPGLVWAGEAPYKPVPSSDGTVVVCPFNTQEQNQVFVCNGGVYVIIGDQILVPVSSPEPSYEEFPHPATDPYLGFPSRRDIPAGVIRH
jgi:hypothetical protein